MAGKQVYGLFSKDDIFNRQIDFLQLQGFSFS